MLYINLCQFYWYLSSGWAFESKNQDIVSILMKIGVPHTDKDKNGQAPVDLLKEE